MPEMLERYLAVAYSPILWITLGLTLVFFLVQALVARTSEDRPNPDARIQRLAQGLGMGTLHPVLFLILAVTWGILAITLFVGLYLILWQIILQQPPETREDIWNWRFLLAQLAALTTVLGGLIALPLTISRLLLARRQTETAEQGHITDRISKAVELLGDSDPAVRMGAILSLDRIMSDSPSDKVMVLNMLNAYIEHHQPATPVGDDGDVPVTGIDVQAALEVLLKWRL